MKSIEKKSKQLGMPFGTASARLRKSILFDLLKRLSINICHQCGKEITSERELSIEHKEPWLDSENPRKLFFSLENIAFSHLSCNCAARRETPECKKIKSLRAKSGILHKVLTEEQVKKVRELLGSHSRKEVLEITGLSKTAIAKIARNETYKEI